MKLELNDKKVLHISHNDTDGRMCHVLSKYIEKHAGIGVEFTLSTISNPSNLLPTIQDLIMTEKISDYDMVLITDLTITPQILSWIDYSHHTDKFKMIDHHRTPLVPVGESKYSSENCHIEYFTTKQECATSLYYDKLYLYILSIASKGVVRNYINTRGVLEDITKLMQLVEITRLYDTYAFTISEKMHEFSQYAERFNLLVKVLDRDDYIDYILKYLASKLKGINNLLGNSRYESCDIERFIGGILDKEESSEKEYIQKKLEDLVATEVPEEIKNLIYKIGSIPDTKLEFVMVIAEKYQSSLGNAICEFRDTPTIAVMLSNDAISMRTSNDNIDISRLASIMSGGGHPKAAGFPVNYDVRQEICDLLVNTMTNKLPVPDTNLEL